MIEVKNVRKEQSGVIALRGLSMKIKSGQIFGILGPKGAGKTTLLLLLCNIKKVTKGEILVNDIPINQLPVLERKKITYLSNGIFLDGVFSPDELVEFYGSLFEIEAKLLEQQKRYLFRFFGIDQVNTVPYQKLSSSMKRRTQLVMGMLHNPEIILCDDLLKDTDVFTKALIYDFLRVERTRGKTIVIATEEVMDIEEIADCITILVDGQKVANGSKDKIIISQGVRNLSDAYLKLYVEYHQDETGTLQFKKRGYMD